MLCYLFLYLFICKGFREQNLKFVFELVEGDDRCYHAVYTAKSKVEQSLEFLLTFPFWTICPEYTKFLMEILFFKFSWVIS